MEITIFGRHKQEYFSILRHCLPCCTAALRPDGGAHLADGILLRCADNGGREILATHGANSRFFRRFPHACVVTCGMSARDSVSCSSITDGSAVVSVVRELPTAAGGFVDVQDICLSLSSACPADRVALLTAACLCAGLPPAEITRLPL